MNNPDLPGFARINPDRISHPPPLSTFLISAFSVSAFPSVPHSPRAPFEFSRDARNLHAIKPSYVSFRQMPESRRLPARLPR
jgi:hypothetical protein